MAKPTEIEKENLEAHVELCAVRYGSLETKLNNLEQRMDKLELSAIAYILILAFFTGKLG